ncbi:MAG: hypothetical protein AAGF31_00630 [Planctomycetota bacterium]
MAPKAALGSDAAVIKRLPPVIDAGWGRGTTTRFVNNDVFAKSGPSNNGEVTYTSARTEDFGYFVGAAQDANLEQVDPVLAPLADLPALKQTSKVRLASSEEELPSAGESSFVSDYENAQAGTVTGEPVPVDAYCSCGGCNSACCDPCGSCCALPCCVPTYWIAGVEATFLAPDLNRGGVSYRLQDEFATYGQLDESFGSEDIDIDDFYVAPRLWLGVQHGCWGIVGRYWHLQAAEAAYDPFTFTPPGPTRDFGYFIHNRFEAYTIDLEGTRSFCCRDFKNIYSFGVRYASLLHDTALSADGQIGNGAGGPGVISGNARSNRRAFGTGITTSLSGRKPLFCDSCIHMFYGLRGSVVWGKITNSVETDTIEVTSGATAGSYNGAFAGVNDAMFIGEVQLGAQVDYRVFCFPADAFFRVAFEYQYWDAGEGAAAATSFAGFGGPDPAPFSQGQAFAEADGLTLDLVGLSIATGFTW